MSKENLFNTPFELSLHVLLLLDTVGEAITLDRILAYDFMAIYGKIFGISDSSLQGENNFAFCELPLRRNLIKKAIRNLVLDRLVLVQNDASGILYKISEQGRESGKNFQSEYARTYKKNLVLITQCYDKIDDVKLFDEINRQSLKLLRR